MAAEEVPLRVVMMGLILGGCASQALRTMVVLDLPDHLAQGPRDIDDLAEAAEVDAGALSRLITVVTALGLCERIDGSATVALTPLGSLLRSDAPGPFKALTSVMTAPWINRAWEELPDAIGAGKSVFEQAHGLGFWDYMSVNPEEGAAFNAAMTGGAAQRAAAILETCDLTAAKIMIDVGGGHGRLVAALLAAAPQMRGVVVDRAEVLAGANAVLAETGVIDRCELAAADFFETVPSGGDVYVLAQILHDWPDEAARKILATCATAMAPGTRLLIVEQVLSSGDAQLLLPALNDINMLVLLGGQERNAAEYRALLDEAGFTDMVVRPTGGAWTVVEATRR